MTRVKDFGYQITLADNPASGKGRVGRVQQLGSGLLSRGHNLDFRSLMHLLKSGYQNSLAITFN